MAEKENAVLAWLKQLKDPNEKIFSKQWFFSYACVIVGTMLFVCGDVLFANPYHLAPGGTYGLSNVLHALTGKEINFFLWCFEIPLLVIGSIILGPRFGIKTIVSTVLGILFTAFLERTWGYAPLVHDGNFFTEEGVRGALAIANSSEFFVPDYIMNTLLAGAIYGVGIGIIFFSNATSGGSDIVSMIINKYTKIPLGTLVIIVDSCIALTTLLISPDLRLPGYSILLIVIEGILINIIQKLPLRKWFRVE